MKKQIPIALVLAQVIALMPMMPVQPASHQSNIVSGDMNSQRTNKLTSEIAWHTSVGQAEADARSQGKLVFWINMLGTLSGAT